MTPATGKVPDPTPEEQDAITREIEYLQPHAHSTDEDFRAAARIGPCFCVQSFVCTKCLLAAEAS